jgi:hypothetical protein
MKEHQRKRVELLRDMHQQVCEEQGDHPDEVDTAFSEGADAIERLSSIEAKP